MKTKLTPQDKLDGMAAYRASKKAEIGDLLFSNRRIVGSALEAHKRMIEHTLRTADLTPGMSRQFKKDLTTVKELLLAIK